MLLNWEERVKMLRQFYLLLKLKPANVNPKYKTYWQQNVFYSHNPFMLININIKIKNNKTEMKRNNISAVETE